MTDVVKEKKLKCFVWTMQAPSSYNRTLRSKNFLLLNSKSYFEFYSGCNSNSDLYLYFKSDEQIELPIKFTVCVTSDYGGNLGSETKTITSSSDETIWRYSRSKYNVQNRLVTFEVTIHVDILKDDKSLQTPPYIDTRLFVESSSKDFSKLFDKGPNHDVEFVFEDQIIKAHKYILCCRSDVFSSMLRSDMVEGETGRVNIEDVEPTIFSQFLRSLYTGMLPELTIDTAVQLYKVSDKYSVDSLKQQCAEFLIDNLSVGNACELLVLADQHSDAYLKMTVREYVFKEKIPAVMGKKWSDFCNENQKLAIEVLNLFYQQLCPINLPTTQNLPDENLTTFQNSPIEYHTYMIHEKSPN